MQKLISILIPAYNEEEVIHLFYKEVCKVINQIDKAKYVFEFLFVNDGSTDNTLKILNELRSKDYRVCYVDLSRNFGKEIALIAGFENVNSKS